MPRTYDSISPAVFADNRGTVSHGQATVAGAVTLRAANASRRSITIQNLGTGTLFVGASGVGTADGYQLKTDVSLTLLRHTDAVYVNATGSCDVRFIEELA